MLRGNQRKDELTMLRILFVTDEGGIDFEIERFWGEMFCLNGNATRNKNVWLMVE